MKGFSPCASHRGTTTLAPRQGLGITASAVCRGPFPGRSPSKSPARSDHNDCHQRRPNITRRPFRSPPRVVFSRPHLNPCLQRGQRKRSPRNASLPVWLRVRFDLECRAQNSIQIADRFHAIELVIREPGGKTSVKMPQYRRDVPAYCRSARRPLRAELSPLGIILSDLCIPLRLVHGHWSALAFPKDALPVISRAKEVRPHFQKAKRRLDGGRFAVANSVEELFVPATRNAKLIVSGMSLFTGKMPFLVRRSALRSPPEGFMNAGIQPINLGRIGDHLRA
jgi:hypothetical protein